MNNVAHGSCDEFDTAFQALAHKFVLLLVASRVPEDVQDSIVALLPRLSIDHILHMVNALEAKYTLQQDTSTDAELVETLTHTMSEYMKRESDRNNLVVKNIHDLEERAVSGNVL